MDFSFYDVRKLILFKLAQAKPNQEQHFFLKPRWAKWLKNTEMLEPSRPGSSVLAEALLEPKRLNPICIS